MLGTGGNFVVNIVNETSMRGTILGSTLTFYMHITIMVFKNNNNIIWVNGESKIIY